MTRFVVSGVGTGALYWWPVRDSNLLPLWCKNDLILRNDFEPTDDPEISQDHQLRDSGETKAFKLDRYGVLSTDKMSKLQGCCYGMWGDDRT